MNNVFVKTRKKLKRLFLRPIRVFVFHHVSEKRNPLVCAEQDWTQTEKFKENIEIACKKFKFISLEEAWDKICLENIRWKKYAVLTSDDGLQTIPYIFPWLESKGIPLTCFINTKYLDGFSHKKEDEIRIKRENPNAQISDVVKKQYMNFRQLEKLTSPLLSIALHGNEHLDSTSICEETFVENITICAQSLKFHPRYCNFFAYPWGKHTKRTDQILSELGFIPVLVDGAANYNDKHAIHRECIDGIKLA